MGRKRVFGAKHGASVMDYVRTNPGQHLRAIQRGLGLPLTSVSRLLNELSDGGQLVKDNSGFFSRYYPRKSPPPAERAVIAALRNRRTKKILEFLYKNPGVNHYTLGRGLRIPPSSLTYHMQKLERSRIVEAKARGNMKLYRLKSPTLFQRGSTTVRAR